MGMSIVLMSVGASFGLCAFMGIDMTDIHPVIPFLLLGISVDDMFVIIEVGIPMTRSLGLSLQCIVFCARLWKTLK